MGGLVEKSDVPWYHSAITLINPDAHTSQQQWFMWLKQNLASIFLNSQWLWFWEQFTPALQSNVISNLLIAEIEVHYSNPVTTCAGQSQTITTASCTEHPWVQYHALLTKLEGIIWLLALENGRQWPLIKQTWIANCSFLRQKLKMDMKSSMSQRNRRGRTSLK